MVISALLVAENKGGARE